MSLFTAPEDILIDAMARKDMSVRIEHCIGSIESVFKHAIVKDPRVLAFLSSYEYTTQRTGLVQIIYDYNLTIKYTENSPASLNDVVIYSNDWNASKLLEKKGAPKDATIIADNPDLVRDELKKLSQKLESNYEGVGGWDYSEYTFKKLTSKTVCLIRYRYYLPEHQLRAYQGKALFAAKQAWKTILGRAKIPQFVMPFLALSYLSSECCIDRAALDDLDFAVEELPSDAIPFIAYGPLIERRGVSEGIAWAFKTMMDSVNIECMCVCGCLTKDPGKKHFWNIVKVDGQYYHVDASLGVEDGAVNVSFFMQPDAMMRGNYYWDKELYPQALGTRFDYSFIEDFLADQGNEYLDAGANESCFFPDEIIE